jgi:tetratricopeptide (TPR) repeat protein
VGRHQYHQATPAGFRLAVEAYERALAMDPGYAPAWAGLAMPQYHVAEEAADAAAAHAQRRRALAAAERAVALSPDLVDGLSSRGYLRAVVALDWTGAMADLERAVALGPGDTDARRRYGLVLAFVGRGADAVTELRKAVRLDPLGHSWVTLGRVLANVGDAAEAEAAFRRYLQVAPENTIALDGLGQVLLLARRPDEALAAFDRCSEPSRLWGRALAEHARGDARAARAALDAYVSRFGATDAFGVARVYAWRGEKERALEWLERSLAQQGAEGPALKLDRFLLSIRAEPRFKALVARMRLPPD